MSRTWYGSLQNRLEENVHTTDEIRVGTLMTEYLWSDRHPYEVIAVQDQKHVTVRAMGHRHIGKPGMTNNWELTHDESQPERLMTKRGKYWYWTTVITADDLGDWDGEYHGNDSELNLMLWLAHNDVTVDDVRSKGKVTRYHRANVGFGRGEYYYDYSF